MITWQKVRNQVIDGKRPPAICEWLQTHHPDFACSPQTLAAIAKAGMRVLLEKYPRALP